MDEARVLCQSRLIDALRDVSKLLAAAEKQGGYLGGKAPDPSDINLGGAVYTVKALLDSGLADVDAQMTPELERYLERWCRRDSWVGFRRPTRGLHLVSRRWRARYAIDATIADSPQLKVYGTGQSFNAVIVRSFANKLCTVAPDVCSPDSVREACDKARRLDPRVKMTGTTTTYDAPLGNDDGAICI